MPSRSPLPPALRGALTAAGLLLVMVGGLYVGLFRLEVKPRIAFVPGWSLVDASGEQLTSEDLRGSVVLYTFTYTGQDDVRRQVLPIVAEVQRRLAAEPTSGVPVRLVTVSFDPERDTPEVLRRTAEQVGADPDVWSFVTGDERAMKHVVRRGFEVFFERREDGSFLADPVFVLADGWGIERARYRIGLPDPDVLVRDIRSVVREVSAASGPARLAYDAAHLFSCYSTV